MTEIDPDYPELIDDWQPAVPIPLDGRLERGGFSPWITIFGGLIIAFVLFQAISTIAVVTSVLFFGGVSFDVFTADLLEGSLDKYAGELIVSNTIGQVLGLLLPILLFAKLHSSKSFDFLRLRNTDARLTILSIIGLVAFIPIVQFIGGAVDSLPWPQSIRDFEQTQMDMIENILNQDFSILFAISMMALTPAICEEVLFRGYIQRQAERVMGIWGAIAFSGIVFGLYHLRPTQAIPLALLGTYMAYVTWRSGSLVPAIAVHLANNSFAVLLGKYMKNQGDAAVDLESIQMPLTIVIPAIIVFVGITLVLHRLADELKPDRDPDM